MDNLAQDMHVRKGPFEQWQNPATGVTAAFVSFPVSYDFATRTATMPTTIECVDYDEHGRRREWEFTYIPDRDLLPMMLSGEAVVRLMSASSNDTDELPDEGPPSDGRWLAYVVLAAVITLVCVNSLIWILLG